MWCLSKGDAILKAWYEAFDSFTINIRWVMQKSSPELFPKTED